MTEVRRPVFMSGENPGITLYEPGTENIRAVASYWHCTDSPLGVGHVLILWAGSACQAIFTDHLTLARRLVEQLTQYFPEFQGVPVPDFSYCESQCGHTFDGQSYRVLCRASNLSIELEWTGLMDRKQFIWPRFPAGEASFDLTTVICPCQSARILVNGSPLAGEVKTTAGGAPSSSAFLAFAETWIGPL
jgi:hypothetical protein